MKKLIFVFDEELFGAFQHGDWIKQDEVETAIKDFLDDGDIEEIRASNGESFDRCADFLRVRFDTRCANRDDRNDEYLVLEIQDRANTDEIPDGWFFSSEPIRLAIEHGGKLVLEKHGSVAHVRWG